MKLNFLILSLVLLLTSCQQNSKFIYQDKDQIISCNNENNDLLNEALYSFEHDIASYYQSINSDIKFLDVEFAYANYIYLGALGNVDLTKIVSEHSINILSLLKEKGYLNNPQSQASNLNYHSTMITCLVNQFKNEELKTSIKSQIEINFLDTKLMADNYRINIRDANTDKYFALFLAFETYYQYLVDMDFSNLKINE